MLAPGDSSDALALAPSVAHDLPELGVMLPYTPLQHLLLATAEAHGMHALVMTSGNLSEEPIETDDDLAWEHLAAAGIADALLGNDRAILSRYDDSVVRVVDGAAMPVRRARGYAPQPLPLPTLGGAAPSVLACGPQQKATIALTREDEDGKAACFVSQHIGDVENGATFDAWNAAHTRLEDLFDLAPAALACDLHPSYLSSQWAREQVRERNLPLVEVQHHHAHIASVMAEAIAAASLRLARASWALPLTARALAPTGPFGAASFLSPALPILSAPHICVPGHFPVAPHPCAMPDAMPLPCSANSACSSTQAPRSSWVASMSRPAA